MYFTLAQHVQDFLMGCRQRGHGKTTLLAYRSALDKFTAYAEAAGVTRAETVTRTLLRNYASSLTEQMLKLAVGVSSRSDGTGSGDGLHDQPDQECK